MPDSQFQPHGLRPAARRRHLILALTLALSAALAATAWAASSTATISQTRNAHLHQQILIDSRGRTLYVLSPENTHHLLCKSSECLAVWPPLTVPSAKKLHNGPGVSGQLGVLRRSNGMLQVTLRGLPLYLYSGDSDPGKANGQNVKSFGGTWHVLAPIG